MSSAIGETGKAKFARCWLWLHAGSAFMHGCGRHTRRSSGGLGTRNQDRAENEAEHCSGFQKPTSARQTNHRYSPFQLSNTSRIITNTRNTGNSTACSACTHETKDTLQDTLVNYFSSGCSLKLKSVLETFLQTIWSLITNRLKEARIRKGGACCD